MPAFDTKRVFVMPPIYLCPNATSIRSLVAETHNKCPFCHEKLSDHERLFPPGVTDDRDKA